ncbi:MAG: ATP12 family chaperone protein [Solirubrobacterales bacterium]
MLSKTIKRFYKQAGTAPAEIGFSIVLDGRPVKTPAGKHLQVDSHRLAEAIVAEWQAQGEQVLPHTMPMTQLASTAHDRIGPERPLILDQLIKYAGTDLLCYRADFPPDLALRQTEAWQPVLDWVALALDAPLVPTVGVIAIEQPAESLAALRAHLHSRDLWTLTAIQAATAAAGSLVLGLALAEGRLTGAEAYALSQLDETYQIEQWGEDEEARQRRALLERDILAAERLLTLTR